MNNTGLEALAALASAVPASAAHSPSKESNAQGNTNAGNTRLVTSAATNRGLSNTSSVASAPSASSSTPNSFQPGSGITQQQWQQVIAAAAASISAFNGNSNLALLAGIQQLNQGNTSSLVAMQQNLALQQQLNYYQMLAQAQKQMGNQGAAYVAQPAPAASSTSGASQDPTTRAISLSLAGHAQASFPSMHGKITQLYITFIATAERLEICPLLRIDGYFGHLLALSNCTCAIFFFAIWAIPYRTRRIAVVVSMTNVFFRGAHNMLLFSRLSYAATPVMDSKPVAATSKRAHQSIPVLASNNMLPPAAPSQPISVGTVGVSSQKPHSHAAIAPQPSRSNADSSGDDRTVDYERQGREKRQLKRVANRRSAQLSRKRKKQFIEELKDENDGLRRKEQILKSIPDLIIVFDSSGKLWFVSESVSRFLDFSVGELEGTSFWNRICEESVRLVKAAFMDSLAARQPESDTVPLGKGCWELRLVDKDGTKKVVTLNGVVHFSGDRPECVCSIRPHDEKRSRAEIARKKPLTREAALNATVTPNVHNHKSLIHVKPQQSVVSNDRSGSSLSRRAGKEAGRVSDSGNSSGSSGFSDSGSSDELNTDSAQVV